MTICFNCSLFLSKTATLIREALLREAFRLNGVFLRNFLFLFTNCKDTLFISIKHHAFADSDR